MRVQMIRPPYRTFHGKFQGKLPIRVGLPLGALYIASVAENRGHDVSVFDSLLYHSVSGDGRFGASWDRIRNEIRKFKPDVVGITNQFTQQVENAFVLAKVVRDIDPEIKIVVGGHHASILPQEFLDTGNFDIAVIGEGEYTMLHILDYFSGKKGLAKARGIAYLKNKKMVVNPPEPIRNLDELPYPAYHMIDMRKYFRINREGIGTRPSDPFDVPENEVSMITSRGCPFNCIFCSIHALMGRMWRAHSAGYVKKHIDFLVENYDIGLIHFEDDNLTLNIERFGDILVHIRKLGIGWDTPNGIRADTLNRKILEEVKRTNVKGLRIAIESGNQEFLNNVINKNLDIKKVIEVSKLCHEIGIPLSAFYIVGFPGETKKNIEETLSLAYSLMKDLNVMPHVNIANPLFGTKLYNICKDKGLIVGNNYAKGEFFSYGRIKTVEFSPEELRIKVRSFYKKIMLVYVLNMLKNPANLAHKIKTSVAYPERTINFIRTSLNFVRE